MAGIIDWLQAQGARGLKQRADAQVYQQTELAKQLFALGEQQAAQQAAQQAPGIARALGALPEAAAVRGQPGVGMGWENASPDVASTMQLLMDPNTRQLGVANAQQLLSPQGRANLGQAQSATAANVLRAKATQLEIDQAKQLGPANLAATQALTQSRLAAARASEATAEAARLGKVDTVEARLQQRWVSGMTDAVIVQDSMQQITAALAQKDSLGALAAVVKLAKILDPNSVVREGEVVTVEGGNGYAEQLVRAYNKAKGEGFSETGAASLARTATSVALPVLKRGQQITSEYRAMAERLGVDARNVTTGLGWSDSYAAGLAAE